MFAEPERLIFAYHDGESGRAGDPLAIEDLYLDAFAAEDAPALKEALDSPILTARYAAGEAVLGLIRGVYQVVAFDERTGRGLTAAETFGLDARFWAWRDEVKRRYRRAAQHAFAYGRPGAGPISYERYCGEVWNLERVQAIHAVQVARGITAAITGKPDESLVDAMAGRESQVGRLAATFEMARIEAEQRAKIGRGELI